MAVSLKQFIRYLDEAEIMTAEAVREWIADQPIEARPIDGDALAKTLQKEGILSKFQAQRLCQGKVRSLLLDNYRLIKIIGRGGMGIVYEAEHRTMKHRVAVKVISSKVTANNSTLRRFFREVEVAAKLSHPNIVTAIDANQTGKKYYMVMELVQGEDLGVIVQRETVLTVPEVIGYMTQAAVGIAYAHNQGVIHRDIKPHNMLLDNDGVIKILDMGLVSLQRPQGSDDDDSITQHNQIIGTVDYMSPEQADDVHHVDQRADIYSLGCSIFRLLVGHPPFPGSSAIQKLLSHRDDPIPSLHDSRDDIPDLLDQIFRRMLAKDPNNRYQSMDEVVGALETCRLATVSVQPNIQTGESVIQSIQSIDLDLGDGDASTMEVERPDILLTVNPTHQPSRRAVPEIESDSVATKRNVIRTFGKVNYFVTFLTIIILCGLSGFIWHKTRLGYVQVQFPVEYRDQRWQIQITSAGKEIYQINESQDDGLSKSNPISISLPPGNYEYTLQRPPYFPETGKFVVTRGATIIVSGNEEDWTTSDLQERGYDNLNPVQEDTNTSQ
ncbi:MAG: serine/threonine protein kinase [Planctomycetaceae bacterium]|jgi:serine/threonine protein kinase|nr:serine/threonine protein kinase [Planctomycetaceae bacterium]MBT4013085.1 serine/threonine protein kinase [Planctomycetaceae bacterium]MBT5123998.1 serine/threonine protein kinase [Planctomycetaceae bacterium]MBT5600054.1 serine/threonine protein kinase [Planctomycetaceae bacterium]MBT5885004.1 serine/threonine protein kinase [Planctomycetaceae bacterium]